MSECLKDSDSILKTIRGLMGPSADYEYFDNDLIIHINAAFSRLCQLGIGPSLPFRITGIEEMWSDFIDPAYQEEVKQYIYMKTRLIFDPPANGSVVNIYKEEIEKMEWLLKEVSRDGY